MVMIKVLLTFCLLGSMAMAQSKTPQQPSKGDPAVRVWVDTQFGFYHCPTTKLYGKTKQGVYMTQKQAQDRGYRPAYSTVCIAPPPPKPKSKAPAKGVK
jgi:hypothetical protein